MNDALELMAKIRKQHRVKNHRIGFFLPAWMRDGYKSEVHYYHDRATPAEKLAAINDKDHPNHDLAAKAAELKL